MTFARSALYVPGDHDRAMAKAASLEADILIFDLEDGVAPERKTTARAAIADHFYHPRRSGDGSLRLVRINHHSTPYYADDITALAALHLDGLMLSKVDGTDDVDHTLSVLARSQRADLPIWCTIETPLGVSNAETIAAHPAVRGIVAGTNDLANDLRIRRTADRAGLIHSLQRLVLAARAHYRIILDGTFINLEDEDGLRVEAEQGRMLGFDGKTLIHPKQISIANEAFGISAQEREEAKAIIATYEAAMKEGKAVTLLDGRMIEALHYKRAKDTLAASD